VQRHVIIVAVIEKMTGELARSAALGTFEDHLTAPCLCRTLQD
jgi:hypothetical protein